VPSNADTLHSQAPHLRQSMQSIMSKSENIRRVFEDGKYEKEIEQLLRYCCPIIVMNSRGHAEYKMRKRNLFYSSRFDNNTQEGEKHFKQVRGSLIRGSATWAPEVFSKVSERAKERVDLEDATRSEKAAASSGSAKRKQVLQKGISFGFR
jgi:hypothetical protein